MFTASAPTATYTLSLHDALPILRSHASGATTAIDLNGSSATNASSCGARVRRGITGPPSRSTLRVSSLRSEEHTSELQSQSNLVCRLLLEKKIFYAARRMVDERV